MSTKKANLILTTCSMAWGTSYIFMKLGIEGLSPLMLMALRTGIAFLILVLIFFKRLLKVNKRLLLYSAITGFLLFTNLTPILYGLNTITASQSGFILSTTVVLVPVIHAVISRRLPAHHVRLGIIIVLIGMVLINGGDIFAVKPGTLLCMLSAFGFQLFNQYCIKQLFYQTGRSTCTRSLPAGLYLSLFHNRSAIVRIPDISEHRVGLDLRSWTCSFVLSLRIRCTNCCAAIYNTGEYRIPVLPGTDLCSDFFLHLPA